VAPEEHAVVNRVAIASIQRHEIDGARADQDLVAIEAPLTVWLGLPDAPRTRSLGVLMRTPGDDRDLILGLLHAEALIQSAGDVVRVDVGASGDGVEIADVVLGSHVALAGWPGARATAGTSACGLCGRLEMVRLDRTGPTHAPSDQRILTSTIAGVPATLRRGQAVFTETGGLHAAGLFNLDGSLLVLREDVGRHNAVDKVIGAALGMIRPDANRLLLGVSGRVAFEIVQKAAMAGVAAVVAVGAPSNLAVEAARASGITLVGFARDGRFNVYAGVDRVHCDTRQ
jgi:FdhD protein